MNQKIIFLLLLALALSMPLAFAAPSKDYSLPSASVNYKLNSDGTVLVHQEINYRFTSGTFSELYIQLPPDLKISGATGACAIHKCAFRTQMNDGWRELVLAGLFRSGESEKASFDYTLSGEILSQKDSSQFFFQLWGDQWQKSVGTLTATVEFPGSASETQYYLHPYGLQFENSSQQNTLSIISKNHPSYDYLEINAIMPSSWFSNLPKAGNYMSRQEIIEGERKEAEAQKTKAFAVFVLSIILFLSIPLSFAACYLFFGRELLLEQLGYQAIYERELPSALSPTEASKLILRGSNADCITAEILNLVQSKLLTLEQSSAKGGFLGTGQEKIVVLKFVQPASLENLAPHQKAVYDFLFGFSENGQVTSKKLSEAATQRMNLPAFQSLESVLQHSFDKAKYLEMRGNNTVSVISVAAIIAAIFLTLTAMMEVPFTIAIIVGSVAAMALANSRPQILGKWNAEGRVLEAKWQNFHKFLNDQTLMREKAPADIILWEHYLIYATAFGISAKVTDAVKARFPSASALNRSPVYSNILLAGALHGSMRSMSSSFHSTASAGHSGGGFGSGGGGGGGGGGAR